MRLVRVAVLAAAAAAAAGVALGGCAGPDWRGVQIYGGAGSIEILTHPAKAEAFRIEPRSARPDEERLGDYPVVRGPVTLSAEDTAALSALLLDPDTYDWHSAKGCEFRPGVGLRLHREASRVEIALCFECDELVIYRYGRRVGVEDFDSARLRLVALVRRLFPEDAEIQALKG